MFFRLDESDTRSRKKVYSEGDVFTSTFAVRTPLNESRDFARALIEGLGSKDIGIQFDIISHVDGGILFKDRVHGKGAAAGRLGVSRTQDLSGRVEGIVEVMRMAARGREGHELEVRKS